MVASDPSLPRIDSHEVVAEAPADVAFESLWRVLRSAFDGPVTAGYARLIRCEPARVHAAGGAPLPGETTVVGFDVARADAPHLLELAGRHHFSRYRLVFELERLDEASTRITATTFASFPGHFGWLYRGLVLGTRIHVLLTRRIVRAAARSTERRAA